MTRTGLERFVNKSAKNRRLYREEKLILDATEQICEVMASKELTRADLAERLEKSRGFITQVLSGTRNMTLRTLADFADVLGGHFEVHYCDDAALLQSENVVSISFPASHASVDRERSIGFTPMLDATLEVAQGSVGPGPVFEGEKCLAA